MDPKEIERMWVLETSSDAHDKKVLFALKTVSANRDEFEAKYYRRKSDYRELKSEVYNLVSFYSVFQGVMFQGVSQLTLSCKFRIIPICLSVFASVATIVGVYMKFSDMTGLQDNFQKYRNLLQVLENTISTIKSEGREFKLAKTSNSSSANGGVIGNPNSNRIPPEEIMRILFEKQLKIARNTKLIVLLYLITFSVGFAYVISVIMCKDY